MTDLNFVVIIAFLYFVNMIKFCNYERNIKYSDVKLCTVLKYVAYPNMYVHKLYYSLIHLFMRTPETANAHEN